MFIINLQKPLLRFSSSHTLSVPHGLQFKLSFSFSQTKRPVGAALFPDDAAALIESPDRPGPNALTERLNMNMLKTKAQN